MPVRPRRPDDRDAVEALLARRLVADGQPALSEHKAIRVGGDGADTTELVLDDPPVVGYAQAAAHPQDAGVPTRQEIEIVVVPGPGEVTRGQLLVSAMSDVLPAGDVRTLWARRPTDVATAERLDWVRTRSLHRMSRPLPVERSGDAPPPGMEVRPFRPGCDEEQWLAVNNVAFAGHPENGALDEDDLAERMALPWFDPAGLLMAWEGERLLGSCWTKLHDDGAGEIYIVGVHPAAQGRGVGGVLVRAALDDLYRRQGARVAMLYVEGSDHSAVGFYRALGFTIADTVSEFRQPEAT